jgi:hypothetical protein
MSRQRPLNELFVLSVRWERSLTNDTLCASGVGFSVGSASRGFKVIDLPVDTRRLAAGVNLPMSPINGPSGDL